MLQTSERFIHLFNCLQNGTEKFTCLRAWETCIIDVILKGSLTSLLPDGMREVSCTANGLLFDIYCLLVWSQLWWMRKVGDSKMFERIKRSDEASASSAQGIQRHGVEGSPQQDSSSSLHRSGQEHPRPGASTVQNRQGYCNCCHVHYSNLEQHIFSSQHRHFATYCRNRMGTSSLMERFLQDVLQHHPHRYHDSRYNTEGFFF